ncbi:MAG: CHRD domain-containing protein [Ignavibacteria bacterium]
MRNLRKIFFSFLMIFTIVLFSQKITLATQYVINIPIDGSQEVPHTLSSGIGILHGTYDDATRSLIFEMAFAGLLGPTTSAAFHGPAPYGVNAPIQIVFSGFPLGVTSGAFSLSLTLTAMQNTQIVNGLWYVNIRTTFSSPGGEIRGQLILYPQSPTYDLRAMNLQYKNLNFANDALEFDIYLQRTGTSGFVSIKRP